MDQGPNQGFIGEALRRSDDHTSHTVSALDSRCRRRSSIAVGIAESNSSKDAIFENYRESYSDYSGHEEEDDEDDKDDDNNDFDEGVGFVPVFSRRRTASMQALHGLDIVSTLESDGSEDADSRGSASDGDEDEDDSDSNRNNEGAGYLSIVHSSGRGVHAHVSGSGSSNSNSNSKYDRHNWDFHSTLGTPSKPHFGSADSGRPSVDSGSGSGASEYRVAPKHMSSMGTLATVAQSKVSAEGVLSASDSITLAPSELHVDHRCGSVNGSSMGTRRKNRARFSNIMPRIAQLVPASASVPKGASVFWFRKHGFEGPWDPLFIVHWVGVALFVLCFGVVLGLYLQVADANNKDAVARWRVVLVAEMALAAVTIILDVLITLRDVEAPEIKSSAQAVAGNSALGRGRNPEYIYERGVPVVSSTTSICQVCNSLANPGTRHCKLCNKCVGGYDHHCRWMNTCIGDANYGLFMAFVAAALLYITVMLACIIRCFCNAGQDQRGFQEVLWRAVGAPWAMSPTSSVAQAASVVFLTLLALYMILVLVAFMGLTFLLGFHIRLRWYCMRTVDYLAHPHSLRTGTSWLQSARRYRTISSSSRVPDGSGHAYRNRRMYSPSTHSAQSTFAAASVMRRIACLPAEGASLIVGSGESVVSPGLP